MFRDEEGSGSQTFDWRPCLNWDVSRCNRGYRHHLDLRSCKQRRLFEKQPTPPPPFPRRDALWTGYFVMSSAIKVYLKEQENGRAVERRSAFEALS